MAVDDTGGRRPERGDAAHGRFERRDLARVERLEIGGAVRKADSPQSVELRTLRVVHSDDQLAAAPMRDAFLRAVRVEPLAALDAETSFEAPGRVIDSGVDHLGVARRRLLADRAVLL